MTKQALIFEILRLPPEERIELLGEAWDAIAASPADVPIPEWHVEELEQRLADSEPSYVAWDEVRARLRESDWAVNVRFRSETVSDVVLAKEWYDAQRSGLGDEFVNSLEQTVDLLRALPEAFPPISETLRRALLRRFPYAVYYRVGDDVIDVIARLHTRRSPRRWRSRE